MAHRTKDEWHQFNKALQKSIFVKDIRWKKTTACSEDGRADENWQH